MAVNNNDGDTVTLLLDCGVTPDPLGSTPMRPLGRVPSLAAALTCLYRCQWSHAAAARREQP
jgi:hypothetical protein